MLRTSHSSKINKCKHKNIKKMPESVICTGKNVWGRNVPRELNLEQIIMLNRIDLQFHTYACNVIKSVNRRNIIYVKSIHVNNRTHNFIDIIITILWTSRSGSDILLFYFGVVHTLRHALRRKRDDLKNMSPNTRKF